MDERTRRFSALCFFFVISCINECPSVQASLFRRNQETFLKKELQCSCECCLVTERVPSEQINGVTTKCVNSGTSSCGESCIVGSDLAVITSSYTSEIEYIRFCFSSCKTGGSPLGEQCVNLNQEEIEHVQTSGGNGEDHALLDGARDPSVVNPAEAFRRAAEAEAAESDADNVIKAESGEKSEVSEVSKNEASLRIAAEVAAVEARVAADAAASERARGGLEQASRKLASLAHTNVQLEAQFQSVAAQAKMFEIAAKEAEKQSRDLLTKVKNMPMEAAKNAAAAAVARIKPEAEAAMNQAKALENRFKPADAPKIAEAAARSAAPYYTAMSKTQGIMGLYSGAAQSLSSKAEDMQQNALKISAQAHALQQAGETGQAAKLFSQTEQLLHDAAEANSQAQGFQNVASQINSGIPAYQVSANAAAARAAALANPPGQPPPPIP